MLNLGFISLIIDEVGNSNLFDSCDACDCDCNCNWDSESNTQED